MSEVDDSNDDNFYDAVSATAEIINANGSGNNNSNSNGTTENMGKLDWFSKFYNCFLTFEFLFACLYKETDDTDESVAGQHGPDQHRVVDFEDVVNDSGNNGAASDHFVFTMED
jgi:hypothetical protein